MNTAIITKAKSHAGSVPKPRDFEHYLLPVNWAGALVNNDYSGLIPEERKRIELWLSQILPGYCLSAEVAEASFSWHGDDSKLNLGDSRCNFAFAMK